MLHSLFCSISRFLCPTSLSCLNPLITPRGIMESSLRQSPRKDRLVNQPKVIESENTIFSLHVHKSGKKSSVTLPRDSALRRFANNYWGCWKIHHRKKEDNLSQTSGISESSVSKFLNGCKIDRGWRRRIQMVQMILLPFIPIIALITQNVISLHHVIEYQKEVSEIGAQVETTLTLGKLVAELQRERAEVSFYIFTETVYKNSNLTIRFALTNEALENVTHWPQVIPGTKKIFKSKQRFRSRLREFRQLIDPAASNVMEVLDWYTNINYILLEFLTKGIQDSERSDIWRCLVSYKNLLRSVEHTGISVVYGINFFGQGKLKQQAYIKYIKHDILGADYLNASLELSPFVKKQYTIISQTLPLYGDINFMREKIQTNAKHPPDLDQAVRYFEAMSGYTDKLKTMQKTMRHNIRDKVNERLKKANTQAVIAMLLLLVVLVICPVIILLVHRATTTIQIYASNIVKKAEELQRQRKKSDRLLFQMLPPSVAQELKSKKQFQAQFFDQVTVYFSDIVGFTEIAAVSTPMEVVMFLNSVYQLFDAKVERYDVYKIETIGDAYMVASGVPVPNGNKQISETCTMALDLLESIVIFQIPHKPGDKLQIRTGIHTGPVVAGVVGTKMPRYCLFGDTVNTASRMESTGVPSKIHITTEMKLQLDEIGGFVVEHRGLVEVKGKGTMDTYWLVGKHGGLRNGLDLDIHQEIVNARPAFMMDVEDDIGPGDDSDTEMQRQSSWLTPLNIISELSD